MNDKIYAPWTFEQTVQLNRYQLGHVFHEFTCYNSHVLIASQAGWFCPYCVAFSQDWAWDFMADAEWLDFHLE